jgi:hypothetical protein
MSLPDDWDGIFYGKETSGDMLFDLTPEEFISTILKQRPGEEFLIAGAICDLLWNKQFEIAEEMLGKAKNICQDQPWEALPAILITAQQILNCGADRETVGTGVNNTVAAFFRGGISIHAFSAPQSTSG